MRKAYLLFTLLCLAFSACKKSTNDHPVTYIVDGLHDVTISQSDVDTMSLLVKYVGPIQENVSLSIEGLPAGVRADFTYGAGVPTFSTKLTLTDLSAAAGLYNIRLKCSGTATGVKYYNLTVRVLAAPVCGLLGNYMRGTSNCDTSTAYYSDTISAVQPVNIDSAINRVRFSNFGGAGYSVFADINCASGNVTVPQQAINPTQTISGTGSFTASSITILYSITTGIGLPPITCQFTLFR